MHTHAKRGLGWRFVCQPAFRTLIISLKWCSCLKMNSFFIPPSQTSVKRDCHVGIRSQSNFTGLGDSLFSYSFSSIIPSPIFFSTSLLKKPPFIILSPDHSHQWKHAGASVPMPRQLCRWRLQRVLWIPALVVPGGREAGREPETGPAPGEGDTVWACWRFSDDPPYCCSMDGGKLQPCGPKHIKLFYSLSLA